jgi:hypothetical protein
MRVAVHLAPRLSPPGDAPVLPSWESAPLFRARHRVGIHGEDGSASKPTQGSSQGAVHAESRPRGRAETRGSGTSGPRGSWAGGRVGGVEGAAGCLAREAFGSGAGSVGPDACCSDGCAATRAEVSASRGSGELLQGILRADLFCWRAHVDPQPSCQCAMIREKRRSAPPTDPLSRARSVQNSACHGGCRQPRHRLAHSASDFLASDTELGALGECGNARAQWPGA